MSIMEYVHRLISSLAFTCIIETAVLYAFVRYVFKRRDIAVKDIVFAGLFASFATIPYVWLIFPNVIDWDPKTSAYVSEPFVFVVEAVFYRFYLRLTWTQAFSVSLACNVVSYFVGPMLRSVGLWIYW